MDAWKMIGHILRTELKRPQEVPNRVYACPYGHGWHMTSAAQKGD